MAEIELRLFRYFVMVAEERHFSRAAERLGITPPTLTHQIQRLESRLDVRLCVRKPKTRVELTEAGKRFLEQARLVLRQAEEAELVARKAARGEIGRIEIGYMMSVSCAGLIQKFVGTFQREHPSIEINLHRMETLVQLNAIAQNELDIGFMRPPNQFPSDLRGFVIYQQPLVLALPSDHPLARSRKSISPSDLKGEKFISTSIEVDLGFRQYTEAVTGLAGFAPVVSKRVPDMFTVLTYVSAGYGLGIISQSLSRLALPNIVFRELAVPKVPLSPIACVHRRNETAPAANAFIHAMRRHKLDG
jgi:DNA-binding transcriptional LysR family regulator